MEYGVSRVHFRQEKWKIGKNVNKLKKRTKLLNLGYGPRDSFCSGIFGFLM